MTREELREQFKKETGSHAMTYPTSYYKWLESRLTRPLPGREELVDRADRMFKDELKLTPQNANKKKCKFRSVAEFTADFAIEVMKEYK